MCERCVSKSTNIREMKQMYKYMNVLHSLTQLVSVMIASKQMRQ